MGIYACPRCGNPNGWWSGNMRDVHDCPGPGVPEAQSQPQSERIPCATCTSEIWCEMNGCKRPAASGVVVPDHQTFSHQPPMTPDKPQ